MKDKLLKALDSHLKANNSKQALADIKLLEGLGLKKADIVKGLLQLGK